MGSFEEGKEVDLSDTAEWNAVQPVAGTVIEIYMPTSSDQTPGDDWAAFFIMQVAILADSTLMLQTHYLGCTDPDVGASLVIREGNGLSPVHMCLSRPCIEVEPMDALHVTTLRMWSAASFKDRCDYVVAPMWKKMAAWEKELAKPSKPARKAAGGTPREPSGVAGKAAATPKRKRRAPGEAAGDGRAMPDSVRAALREKLEKAKKKKASGEAPPESPVRVEESESLSDDSDLSAEAEELTTGLELSEERHRALRRRRKKESKPLEDQPAIKDISMKSLRGQLTQRAIQMIQDQKRQKAKRKSKKNSKDVVNVLAKILTKSTNQKKDKKDKKRKKKRTLADGTIVSCSGSSTDSSSEEEEKGDSESDLEAPLRKRSRDKPGSVLALLVGHVREQLEQASLTELPGGEQLVTGGVKLSTYFALHVKPAYPGHLRELREMHSLAAIMDQLRRGDVARVGDSLAARFMALHQAMIDNNWATAKHMELHSMDDASAGSAAIILASRKHSRLVDKVNGKGSSTWGSWGWNQKGRGKGGWKGGYEQTSKGEKGKGKDRGKKGKQKGPHNQSWDDKTSEWAKAKEGATDK